MTFVRFGLIVTGRGEEQFLPKLFRPLMGAAHCTFQVIRRSKQLSPLTSSTRILKMTGKGKLIPSIDEELGLAARQFLLSYQNSYVLVIDDLEFEHHASVADVFARYRSALDVFLSPSGVSNRASVHFLVNMLEAYYFADPQAVNQVALTPILHAPFEGDVESIPHPKNELKAIWSGFHEVEHGRQIVACLNVDVILGDPSTCCFLRSLLAWCVERLVESGSAWDGQQLRQRFCLPTGARAIITGRQ